MTSAGEPATSSARTFSLGQAAALLAVLTGAFMSMLDDFIVNVSTAAIRDDLGASYSEVQLMVASYVLVYGLTLITGGRLGDLFGHRRMFIIGIVGFTAASAACAMATDAVWLIVFRVVQAVGAAVFYPQVLALLQLTFTGRARAAAFSAFGATVGLAAVSGQLIGGILVSADLFGLSWRPIFLINVPVGIAVLLVGAARLPQRRETSRPRLDLGGTILSWIALGMLTVPLILGHDMNWPGWLIVMLSASIPATAVFVAWERRLQRRGGSPLVPPTLFRIRSFSVGTGIAVLFFAGNSAVFFLLPLQLQLGLDHTALYAGLTFTPLAAAFVLGSAVAPRLQCRIGMHVLTAGYALTVVGNLGLLATVLVMGTSMTGVALLPSMLVLGLGEGFGMSPLVGASIAEVADEDSGAASGVLQTTMQLGTSIGVAIIGTVFFAVLAGTGPTAQQYTDAFTIALVIAPILAVAVTILAACLAGRKAPVPANTAG